MKKRTIIILIILIALAFAAGYFIVNKVNEEKRSYVIEDVSEYKFFVVKIDEKYGVIDKTGKTIIDAHYDKVRIPNPSKDVFICYKDEKGIAYNSNKQQLFAEYNSISAIDLKNISYDLPYEKSVLRSEKGGKFGLIDFSGEKILDTEYEEIENLENVEGQVTIKQNGKLGVANIKGTIIVKPEYDIILGDGYYSEEVAYKNTGYIVGNKNEDGYKYGYKNNEGKLKVKVECNDIERIAEINNEEGTYLVIAKNGQYGVIKNGKNIINNEYQAIEFENSNKLFVLKKGEKYGIADINGKTIVPLENTAIQVKGEYIYAEKNNIKIVYDIYGNKADIDFNKTIMPTKNENYKITINSNENNNYYGVVNAANTQIIKPEYLYIEYAFENYFIACGQDGKLGVLDSNGNAVIELKYDLVQKIQNKDIIQTLISDTNTTELYSNNMKNICTTANATVESKEDYIKVYSSTEINYYDNQGNAISSSSVFPNHKLFANCKDGKWGYIDASGNTKIEYKYNQATEFNDYGFAAVKQDGKWGVVNASAEIVLKPTYQLDQSYGEISFIGEYLETQDGFGNKYYTKDI